MNDEQEQIEQSAGEPPGGQGVGLDPHHVRGHARMVSRMLSLGCIEPAQIETLLRGGVGLAARAAAAGKARDFAAVMGIYIASAKLELERDKYERPKAQIVETRHTGTVRHVGTVGIDERRTQLIGVLHSIRDRAGIGPDRGTADGRIIDVEPAAVHREPVDSDARGTEAIR